MGPLLVLAVVGAALVGLSVATARRPAAAVPDLDGYLARWQALHAGYDPRGNPWVRGWLRVAFVVARPLARGGVAPDVVTLWTVWLALAVLVAALAGGRWVLLGALLLVASGLGDTLDGAVAALTDRATRWGYVLDSLVDRVSDVISLLAVWAVGGHPGLAVAAGSAFGLLEYLRARAANAGMGGVGVVTVGERPTRVIVCALALLAAGAVPERAALLASAGLGVLAVLSAAGLGHLLVVVRRRLLSDPPD